MRTKRFSCFTSSYKIREGRYLSDSVWSTWFRLRRLRYKTHFNSLYHSYRSLSTVYVQSKQLLVWCPHSSTLCKCAYKTVQQLRKSRSSLTCGCGTRRHLCIWMTAFKFPFTYQLQTTVCLATIFNMQEEGHTWKFTRLVHIHICSWHNSALA